jgi:sialidase-1
LGPHDAKAMPPSTSPAFTPHLFAAGARFANLAVALDGSFVLTEGGTPTVPPPPGTRLASRRSHDGGVSWSQPVTIAAPAIQGGGMTVDEVSGAILCFSHPSHPHPRRPRPPFPARMFRSDDHGRTWREAAFAVEPDIHGHVPALHMAEHGITLQHGAAAGRLLRPARVYHGENHRGEPHLGYNIALFSDDRGRTWRCSAPFPDLGTGEGAVIERVDGTVLYSSRKQYFHPGQTVTSGRWFARSRDGGETWDALHCKETLPDGPRYRGPDRRGSNYNGHYGILAGLAAIPLRDPGNPGREILLYSSPDTPGHERIDLTFWASFDGGNTWPVKRCGQTGPAAYSTLAVGRPGTASAGWIGCAFESGVADAKEGVTAARFTLGWLLRGTLTGDGTLPAWALAAAERPPSLP